MNAQVEAVQMQLPAIGSQKGVEQFAGTGNKTSGETKPRTCGRDREEAYDDGAAARRRVPAGGIGVVDSGCLLRAAVLVIDRASVGDSS